MSNVFGNFVGAHHVEAAVMNLLWKWLPTYTHEVSREANLDPTYLQPIRGWRVSSEMARLPEDQIPAFVLVNRGVTNPPYKHNDSAYLAIWEMDLGVQVVAKGSRTAAVPRALTLARMYITAVRLAVIQQRDEDGVMGMTDWRGEMPNPVLEAEDDRTVCLAATRFHITTDEAGSWGEGPIEPLYPPEPEDQPPPDRPQWPVALTHELDLQKIPYNEEEG